MILTRILSAILVLGFWAQANADVLSVERVAEIKALANALTREELIRDVQFIPDHTFPHGAGAKANSPDAKIIVYNPSFTNEMAVLNFIMFHELGHIHLGHTKNPYPGPEAAHGAEVEADTFACATAQKYMKPEDKTIFLNWARTSESVPPERLQFFISCLN